MAGNLRREIADPSSSLDRIRRLGAELYRVLFSGIDSFLSPGRRLLISLDGSFEGVPFEALVDFRGRWFGEQHSISYSLPFLSAARPHHGEDTTPPRVLAVGFGGASRFMGREFPQIPEAETEAREAAEAFPGGAAILGEQASPEALRRALPDARIFHFAGHVALFPENAALVLSSGPLWASQLSESDLRACRLAVLSACSTAPISDDTGSAAVMARAFLRAGVPRVVAARWDVDSHATSAFMHSFYGQLRAGSATDDALTVAASRVREMPQYAHPYYWAAFGLYSN
jgi:CHAT domain-containing protein